MITLFSFSMSYGFDGETSKTITTLANVWSVVVETLMFPLNDLWVELPKTGFWTSSIFEWFWFLLNSTIWSVTISTVRYLFQQVKA